MNEKSVFALGIAPPKCQWKNWKKEIGTENKIKKTIQKEITKDLSSHSKVNSEYTKRNEDY